MPAIMLSISIWGGKGIFALTDIPVFTFISEYTGEIVDDTDGKAMMQAGKDTHLLESCPSRLSLTLLTVLFMDSSRRTTITVTTRWGPPRMHLQQRQVVTASMFIWTFLQDLRMNSPTTGNKARSPIPPRITRNEFF